MNKKEQLIGRSFTTSKCGELVVVDYITAHKVLVEFVATGYRIWTSMGRVRSGGVKDKYHPSVYGVGYLGEGAYVTGGRNRTEEYSTWYNMLCRCYSPAYQKQNPSYIGCSVHPHWHNFQNFAAWLEEQGGAKGRHLDKDSLFSGNKIYSPTTCKLVSARENIKFSNDIEYSFTSPDGEVYSGKGMADFARTHGLDASALSKLRQGIYTHHKGWTLSP